MVEGEVGVAGYFEWAAAGGEHFFGLFLLHGVEGVLDVGDVDLPSSKGGPYAEHDGAGLFFA